MQLHLTCATGTNLSYLLCLWALTCTVMAVNCNDSNNSDLPIIRRTPPPPFPGKIINYCIPSIQTPTFQIIILISEHLHLAELKRGRQTSNSIQQFLWSFSGVTEHLPAYYGCFRMSTRLLKSFPNIY